MHRQPLLSLLNQYRQTFTDEHEVLDRLHQFVRDYPDCFQRELTVGHITGSAWVVDQQFSRTLLTHHRKLNRWLQPGGHADGETDILSVAMREAEEECGLERIEPYSQQIFDVDIHLIPERGSEPAHYHYDCRFLLRSSGSDDYQVSEESHDLAWIEMSNVDQYTDEESVLRMVRKTRALSTGELQLQTGLA